MLRILLGKLIDGAFADHIGGIDLSVAVLK